MCSEESGVSFHQEITGSNNRQAEERTYPGMLAVWGKTWSYLENQRRYHWSTNNSFIIFLASSTPHAITVSVHKLNISILWNSSFILTLFGYEWSCLTQKMHLTTTFVNTEKHKALCCREKDVIHLKPKATDRQFCWFMYENNLLQAVNRWIIMTDT